MTGDYFLLSSFTKENEGHVMFGNNVKGKILGIDNMGITSSPIIENILLIDSLKYNLLSISQFCDKGYRVIFEPSLCLIENTCSKEIIFEGERKDNIYTIDIEKYFS
ncbi:hypothetical protein TorRG33x02_017830 [Trema orientale]|uniref:Retrovirus-related Pol polyprotein from transposon TNT 1-94-like beta-barrel domain-containing protein n=1 Tax=Trema orientale TaxID=63057 RepID=A0A2P5FYF8_TREOI|nr:hypothetical protein TorRG33x02_017830 [Trema orientale]